jgi:hypothetical protein
VLHRVILRHPPPSGRSSWTELRRMMTRFLLFHQTQDTTPWGSRQKIALLPDVRMLLELLEGVVFLALIIPSKRPA